MSSSTLAVGATVLLASALLFAYVGARVRQRHPAGPARGALRAFGGWWYAFAALNALTGILSLLTAANVPLGAPAAAIAAYGSVPLYAIAFHGILHYLLYLYKGWPSVGKVLGWSLGAYALLIAAAVYHAEPSGFIEHRWQVIIAFNGPGDLVPLLLLPLTLAPVVLAGAYARLAFKLTDRSQKYRVTLVSAALFTLAAFGLVTTAAGLATNDAAQLLSRGISLAAAAAVLAAYEPPALLRRRYGLRSFREEIRAEPQPEREVERKQRGAEFRRRVGELV